VLVSSVLERRKKFFSIRFYHFNLAIRQQSLTDFIVETNRVITTLKVTRPDGMFIVYSSDPRL